MERGNTRRIIKISIYSRLILLVLQYVFNVLIPDHDAGVFIYPKGNVTEKLPDKLVNYIFGGLLRWDAQYFMHIAKYGYTYENTLAFFPLFPLLNRFCVDIFQFNLIFSIDSGLLLSFVLFNVIVFTLSALTLYKLSLKLFNEEIANTSTMLFCINPSSIFFIAPYSECLFSFLSFRSMLNCILLYEKYSNLRSKVLNIQDFFWLIPIALSTVTRSNGILNLGFLLYALGCVYIKYVCFTTFFKKIWLSLAFTTITIMSIVFCIFPFDVFQLYSYKLFCSDFPKNISSFVEEYGDQNKFVFYGSFSQNNQSWCYDNIPLAYSYVQNKYWDVGFMSYYKLKQIPNFLLAFPILGIFIYNLLMYIFINFPRRVLDIFQLNSSSTRAKTFMESSNLWVFVIHGLFLTLFCIFFVHIQVSTRLLCSSSPLLYWISASYILSSNSKKGITSVGDYIIYYFLGYFIIGSALFANFLPWT